MKAIGMYIFSGSQTIGHLETGWEVDQILEMTDDMAQTNAFHFVRNYAIPIIPPSEWEYHDSYLNSLTDKYDLLFANPPCSGLSSINRNARVDNKVNEHIYEVASAINVIAPKAFLIENAPTLVTRGLPILKDIQKILSKQYRITIITDLAGNHNVPMYRKRTLVVGWRRDIFDKMPIINQIVENTFTVGDAFKGLEGASNMEPIDIKDSYDFSRFYSLVNPDETVVKAICRNLDSVKKDLNESELRLVLRAKEKYDLNKSVWDKSPLRLNNSGRAPSITSVNRYIHPTEDRDIYVRECARLMGYPDSYRFYKGSKVSDIQCIAQGVPVNFIKYISNEIMKQFSTPTYWNDDYDVMYINQVTGVQNITTFKSDEFALCDKINHNDSSLQETILW